MKCTTIWMDFNKNEMTYYAKFVRENSMESKKNQSRGEKQNQERHTHINWCLHIDRLISVTLQCYQNTETQK